MHSILQAITDHLLTKHEVLYTGRWELEIDEYNKSYTLSMGLNKQDRPLLLGGNFDTDEDFIAYVNKELDSKRLFLTEYYTIKMTDSLNRT